MHFTDNFQMAFGLNIAYFTKLKISRIYNVFAQAIKLVQSVLFKIRRLLGFLLPPLMPISPLLYPYPAKKYIFSLCRSHFVHNFSLSFLIADNFWQPIYLGSQQAGMKLIRWPTQHWKCKIVGQSQLDFCQLDSLICNDPMLAITLYI